ncbi:YveK family protein [Rossellomorea sp. BNER]|uniref:YveK family protein n=1 Tax=Rossellomorea sp. BNER TaxID=2962031 RepID=UPI003AF2270E|nr:Wzz/FepE/Etk N-terminal domain-containing protein [Rossellomorea sp. BNER]
MEETISLRELLNTLKKRLSLIVIITALATMVSGLISFFVLTPVYQSSTQLLVNQSKSEQPAYNLQEIQSNLQLINTYNVIMKSPAILDKVVSNLDLKMTSNELNEKITVQSEEDSQVVNVSVQDEDPQKAADIANETVAVFKEEIVKIMNVDNVSVLSKAEVGENVSPIKPKPLLNIAIALVVGLMTGVGLAFLLEYFDNTIKTEQDIEKILELPVLASVTTIKETDTVLESKRKAERRTTRGESFGS